MIEVGSQVHWTVWGKGPKTITARRREGVVTRMSGSMAAVLMKSGRLVPVNVDKLRLMSEPSEITQLVDAVRGAAAEGNDEHG